MRTAKRALRRLAGEVAPSVWSFRPKNSLTILTYHPVLPDGHADRSVEQPGMCVSPDRLASHIVELKKHFEIVDLADWMERSRNGSSLPDRACAFTFDDGWKDNFEFALPVLLRHRVPCTVFLVVELIDGNGRFWPNRLAHLMREFRRQAPAAQEHLRQFLVRVGANPRSLDESVDARLVDAVITSAKAFSDAEIIEQMDYLECQVKASGAERSVLNSAEISAMGASGLVRFGSHGLRHVRLSAAVSSDQIESEVVGSRDRLRTITPNSVDIFCYPNGEYSAAALAAVRRTYAAAVTTELGWNWAGTDRCRLRRISLHDSVALDNVGLLARVSGWL